MRLREARLWGLATALALLQTSCLVLPVRTAPGVTGQVLDQVSGAPVADAIVVVRFDSRSRSTAGHLLPDREILGHAEVVTDAQGRFEVERYLRAGISAWPLVQTEARIVSVMAAHYRCPSPITVAKEREARVMLTPALDDADRRDSCRPVAARRSEANEYMTAWRALFPAPPTAAARETERQIDRVLEARAALGYGENCKGPVHDLALAPDGRRAAIVSGDGDAAGVQLIELSARGPGVPMRVSPAKNSPPRRLAWTSAGDLVLWEPSSKLDRAVSPSIFAPGHSEVVWRSSNSMPASIDRGTPASSRRTSRHEPLDPANLSDEADWMWRGRSFALERSLDAATGLTNDRLRVRSEDGNTYSVDLPGETCGPSGRFGRPHYRITSGGRAGLDLRYVDGGCHAIMIDLVTGDWVNLDQATAPATCRLKRQIPPAHLRRALRGWTQELRATLTKAGADLGAAYALRIKPDGTTAAYTRNYAGDPLHIPVPAFPIATPLRRIDVTNVAPPTSGPRIVPGKNPRVLEPL